MRYIPVFLYRFVTPVWYLRPDAKKVHQQCIIYCKQDISSATTTGNAKIGLMPTNRMYQSVIRASMIWRLDIDTLTALMEFFEGNPKVAGVLLSQKDRHMELLYFRCCYLKKIPQYIQSTADITSLIYIYIHLPLYRYRYWYWLNHVYAFAQIVSPVRFSFTWRHWGYTYMDHKQ